MTDPTPPGLRIPLPQFRQPRPADPALPTVPSDEPSSAPPAPSPEATESRPAPAAPASPEADRPTEPLPPIAEPPAAGRTGTSGTKPKADPNDAAKVLGGLLMIALASAGVWMARNGLALRQPTIRQRDDISTPLGRIIARYLPAELVNGTLVDVTEAASATHAYVLDDAGPLITRTANPFRTEE